jgi:hypothetical protein
MSAHTEGDKPELLNSWKEIAAYLGRGVRTVQRWEAQLGMPVHRPHGHLRSAVLALTHELDGWLRTTPQLRPIGDSLPANVDGPVPQTIEQVRSLRDDCRSRLSSFQHTAQVHHQAVERLMTTIGNIEALRTELKGLPVHAEGHRSQDRAQGGKGQAGTPGAPASRI